MKITAYNQHDVGSSHEPWSCFIAYQSTRDGPTSLCNQAKRRTPCTLVPSPASQGIPTTDDFFNASPQTPPSPPQSSAAHPPLYASPPKTPPHTATAANKFPYPASL